jgi:hypothetical protein
MEGCRSWKHTPQEQEEERARFKSRNLGRFNTNTRNFDRRFREAYQQYVAELEGSDSEEDDLTGAFQTLLMDNDDSDHECDTPASGQSTQFFTTTTGRNHNLLDQQDFGSNLATELANRACVHQLTAIAPTSGYKPDTPELLTPELLTTELLTTRSNTSRYSLDHFYGIVIDTSASKYSIAGFAQF